MSELRRAESVLAEAKSYGVIDKLPEEEKDIIKMADELIERARIQHDKFHNREPMVSAILFAAEINGNDTQKENVEENAQRKEAPTDPWAEPSRSAELSAEAERRECTESPSGEPRQITEIPEDFTTLSDREIRQLHSRFNALAAHYGVQLVHEENEVHNCKLVADTRRNQLIAEHPEKNKYKSVALLDADISGDEQLQQWRLKQFNHEKKVRMLKMQRDISNTNVDRLSREWSMRTQERDGSGQLYNKQIREN